MDFSRNLLWLHQSQGKLTYLAVVLLCWWAFYQTLCRQKGVWTLCDDVHKLIYFQKPDKMIFEGKNLKRAVILFLPQLYSSTYPWYILDIITTLYIQCQPRQTVIFKIVIIPPKLHSIIKSSEIWYMGTGNNSFHPNIWFYMVFYVHSTRFKTLWNFEIFFEKFKN